MLPTLWEKDGLEETSSSFVWLPGAVGVGFRNTEGRVKGHIEEAEEEASNNSINIENIFEKVKILQSYKINEGNKQH